MTHYTGSVPALERTDDWRHAALCAESPYSEIEWCPTPGDERSILRAQAVCAACPVRQACLEEAMSVEGGTHADKRHAIRGGLTGHQRRRLYERRRKRAARLEAAA
ncbi:WhiB family transcriptional regulator [Streptomyces sp. NPDC003299]